MKNITKIAVAALVCAVALISCQKKFDAKTYAPNKPLPSYGGFSSSSEIESASLIDYFNFNGSNTDSVGALKGTGVGSIGFTDGVSGKAFQGAASSYLLFSDPGALKSASSYSISFWMKSGKTAGLARGIFSMNNPTDFWGSLDIYLDNPTNTDPNGDTLLFKVHMTNNSGVPYAGYFLVSKVPNAINVWTHMVVTYDAGSSTINIYQNAKPIGISGVAGVTGYKVSPIVMPGDDPTKTPETLWGPIVWPSPTAAVLGTWQFQTNPSLTASATVQTWAESYVGALDNFRIYNKALTAIEVSALFNLEEAKR